MEKKETAEPIAIVGIGCRFPGASNPNEFWNLLRDGVDAISEVPPDRWNVEDYYDPDPSAPGKMNTRWGGFLKRIDLFDAPFFRISPREAARMDPQQRLLLEVAWEALEDGGQPADKLARGHVGVFIGIGSSDYFRLNFHPSQIDGHVGTGNNLSIAANRLSYFFDFRGPCLAVDTACSSSLVAVHLACQSLERGESSLAIAGGVSLTLSPEATIALSQGRTMSPDGRCKTFDASANGYVRGEGCGIVVLKTLPRALADGDRIHAVIRGTAVNQDGRTNGLTAPNRKSQEEVIAEACRRAGVSPRDLQYVETHGTGTPLGDPIEALALGSVLAPGRVRPCPIGSVKTNIGHLEAAAGVAGLIKVVLSLGHAAIPPSLHFEKPNPHIPLEKLPLEVQTALAPWPDGHPRFAGVSSFGFGGTNAHLVVEEAPPPSPEVSSRSSHVLPLSARSDESLRELVEDYRRLLSSVASPALHDLCYTASARRTHHDRRLSVVSNSPKGLADGLDAFLKKEPRGCVSWGRKNAGRSRKTVFLFPGQGPKWSLGTELLQEPVFREKIEECSRLLKKYVSWELIEELTAGPSRSRLSSNDVAQPSLFSLQVALAALWRSWGIEPDLVVGQSMGEIAAAHVAGALTLEDAIRIAFHRGRLIQTVAGRGKMAVVELSLEESRRALKGYEARVSVAASNGPSSTILSGEPHAIDEIAGALKSRGVFSKFLDLDFASHSPQMEPLVPEFLRSLEGVSPGPASIPIVSTVTGKAEEGTRFGVSYWGRNLREPVLLAPVLEDLYQKGHDLFLEVGPHPVLSGVIRGSALASLHQGKKDIEVMLSSLGFLYGSGADVAWDALYPQGGRVVSLPLYPWNGQRCWMEAEQPRSLAASNGNHHPLLGPGLDLAPSGHVRVWENEITAEIPAYLQDHRVQDAVLFPAAATLEMALAAAHETRGTEPWSLKEIALQKALVLPETGARSIQFALEANGNGEDLFRIYSRTDGEKSAWTHHVSGKIVSDVSERAGPEPLDAIRERCREEISVPEFYERLGGHGLHYGPLFQGLGEIRRRDGEALGLVRISESSASSHTKYRMYPPLLDACLQVLAAAIPSANGGAASEKTYLPVGLRRLKVFGAVPRQVWSHAVLKEGHQEVLEGNVTLRNDKGETVAVVEGLQLMAAGTKDWFYEIQWEPKNLDPQDVTAVPGSWLILTDRGGLGRELSRLLQEQGQRCLVSSPEELSRSLEEILKPGRPPCRGIVSLGGLDVPAAETGAFEKTEEDGASLLKLIQALVQKDLDPAPRLFLVTRGSQPVKPAALAVSQAPLWGLGRVLALEHPSFFGFLADLDAEDSPAETAASLLKELLAPDGENQLAFRKGQRYVARLSRKALPPTAESARLLEDATYLIGGGLGALGLAVAQRLIDRGARRLVLMGRTSAEPRDPGPTGEALKKMEASGARVLSAAVDVSQRQEVAALLERLKDEKWPPVRGVIQAAGILRDQPLVRMSVEDLRDVLKPKAAGTWWLHRLLQNEPLDFFVCFSSAASLLGSPGQGNYAAANAFQDALMQERRFLGLPGLSINWGPWSDIGLAAKPGGRIGAGGIDPIAPSDGLEILERLLASDAPQIAVLKARWPEVLERYSHGKFPPLLTRLGTKKGPSEMKARVLSADVPEKRRLIETFLRTRLGLGLGLPPDAIDPSQPLSAFGLDSITALELKNAVEDGLGAVLPLTALLEEPTLHQIAERILSLIGAPAARAEGPARNGYRLPAPHDFLSTAAIGAFRLTSRLLYGLEAKGLDRIPEGPAIFCPNHESHLDPIFVASLLPASIRRNLIVLSKREHFDAFITRRMAVLMRAIPVDRHGDAGPSLDAARRALREGRSVLIYPEGTRTETGGLGAFKSGAALLAIEEGMPIVPVRIRGAFEIYPKSRSWPRLADWKHFRRLRLEIRFGNPLRPQESEKSDAHALAAKVLTERLREAISSL